MAITGHNCVVVIPSYSETTRPQAAQTQTVRLEVEKAP